MAVAESTGTMPAQLHGGGLDRRRLVEVMGEFLSALRAPETYAPLRNHYILFGFLWGVPVPLLGMLIHLYLTGSVTGGRGGYLVADPLFIFLVLHPLLFGVVFGAMGTVRLRKNARIAALMAERQTEMQRLQEAHAELQQLSRLQDEFLGSVTHELKTPLVTIRGYAEMLDNGRLGAVTDKQRQALAVMQRNCQRLQQQIELLLSASRNQSPATTLNRSTFPLQDLADEVMERQRFTAEQKNIRLSCQLPATPLHLHGDFVRLVEVLDNLLGNALKFTQAGGWVTLTCAVPQGNRVPCEVADSGLGIAPEAQGFIFERFRQADGSIRRRYGGSGIGLALVKENLAAHGCPIRVESEPGHGARFIFELPLAPAATAERKTTSTEVNHGNAP